MAGCNILNVGIGSRFLKIVEEIPKNIHRLKKILKIVVNILNLYKLWAGKITNMYIVIHYSYIKAIIRVS